MTRAAAGRGEPGGGRPPLRERLREAAEGLPVLAHVVRMIERAEADLARPLAGSEEEDVARKARALFARGAGTLAQADLASALARLDALLPPPPEEPEVDRAIEAAIDGAPGRAPSLVDLPDVVAAALSVLRGPDPARVVARAAHLLRLRRDRARG